MVTATQIRESRQRAIDDACSKRVGWDRPKYITALSRMVQDNQFCTEYRAKDRIGARGAGKRRCLIRSWVISHGYDHEFKDGRGRFEAEALRREFDKILKMLPIDQENTLEQLKTPKIVLPMNEEIFARVNTEAFDRFWVRELTGLTKESEMNEAEMRSDRVLAQSAGCGSVGTGAKLSGQANMSRKPISIETQVLIDGCPAFQFSDNELYERIRAEELKIDELNKIRNQPLALMKEIETRIAGIKTLVDYMNAREKK